jgi:ferredoxin
MRIKLDREACQGHGLCAMYAEELFAIDAADGRAIVVLDPVPPPLEDRARRTVRVCPEVAISIDETG